MPSTGGILDLLSPFRLKTRSTASRRRSRASDASSSRTSSRSCPAARRRRSSSWRIATTPATFIVHRDNSSGTAALVELARAYTETGGATGVKPQHTIVFLSTDGGAFGGLGARHFVEHAPEAKNVLAVVNLDTIATNGRPADRDLRAGPALAVADAPRLGRRADRRTRPARTPGTAEPVRAARRPRLPAQPLRAVAVPPARDLRDHADDRRRPPVLGPAGRPVRRRSASGRWAGRRRRSSPRSTRDSSSRRERAATCTSQGRIVDGLGARARADRARRPVRRRRRSTCSRAAGAATSRSAPRFAPTGGGSASGSGSARCSGSSRSSAPSRAGPRCRPIPPRARPATGRGAALDRLRRCSRRRAGSSRAGRLVAETAGDRRGGARRPDGGPARARPDLAARDGDERLRARPLPAVAARLAVAAAGARPSAGSCARPCSRPA